MKRGRKGMTLRLLWLEHLQSHPDGYQYSWFCDRYREWRGRLDKTVRQVHRAGDPELAASSSLG